MYSSRAAHPTNTPLIATHPITQQYVGVAVNDAGGSWVHGVKVMRRRERGRERKGTWPEGRGHKSGGVVVKEVVEARGGRKTLLNIQGRPSRNPEKES
ncbi:hypothetical protein E2C01_046114 [Portunus trituberculatus]|uniref:Uncharacterized protein n=1 Tax=Portunus trituberculatus TaxID=210409 RepID=A0A5B7FXK3_PORTR|nr:hypothetical protein [Portunus trituberculatus]